MSPTEPKKTLIARYPLKKVKIIKRTLLHFLQFMILGVFFAVAVAFVSPLLSLLILIALAMLAAVLYAYNVFYYRNYFYDLTADGLLIGKGVISSWRITVPAHKIQDVYLDQDLLDRIFGLYDLHLSTPTDASEREAHIDGLGKDDAESVRSLFLNWLTGKDTIEKSGANAGEQGVLFMPAKIGLSESIASKSLGTIILLLWVTGLYGLLAAIVIVPIVIAYACLDYSAIRYCLRRDGILVRRGFFIPKESIFLYRNIQDVEDMQTLMDRIFGTHTLVIKTMTAASAVNAQMIYLPSDSAQKIREDILLRCKSSTSEADETAHSKQKTTAKSVSKPQVEVPEIKALQSPYKNYFMRSAGYSAVMTATPVILLALFLIGILSVLGMPFSGNLIFVPAVILIIAAFIPASLFVSAAISSIAYTYEIASEYAQIQIRFITTTKRQMLYRKIQDIEKHVSFANSFAHLADIKLETGSKELMQSGRNQQTISSATVANEIITALKDEDAEKLKLLVAKQMGIRLDSLGDNPLVRNIPLSIKKPLKKTMWWAVFSLVILVCCAAAAAIANVTQMLTVTVCIICSAATGIKYLYEREYLKRYYYDANNDVIVIKKGVFGSRELIIPFNKVQDVYINQDLLDIVFGLYDVYVSTATSRSLLNAHIDGLEAANAEAAALLLVDKIAESK